MKNKSKSPVFSRLTRLRYGTGAALVILLVITAAVLFQLAADHTEEALALDQDLSFNGAAVQSLTGSQLMASLDRDVQIYLVSSGTSDYDTAYSQTAYLAELLKKAASQTEHLTWKQTTLAADPTLAVRFSDQLGGNAVSEDCMIVTCRDTGRTRIINSEDYYTLALNDDYSYTYRVQYEKCIAEAILSVTQDQLPVLQFLYGHGEYTQDELSAMIDVLENANWEVKFVSMDTDELDPQSPLFILSPRRDLNDSELIKLNAFAAEGGHFFLGFEYSDTLDMPNFNTLLAAYGAEAYPGVVLADDDAPSYSYWTESYYLLPYLQDTTYTHDLIQKNENVLLAAGARAFKLTTSLDHSISLTPILITDKVYIRDVTDGNESILKQEGDLTGNFALAVISERITASGERSRAFITGNLSMFYSTWIQQQTSSKAFLLSMVQAVSHEQPIDLAISSAPLSRNGMTLQDVTLPIVITILLPLMVLVIALIILLPRRNK